ncbi:MAG: 2-dehydropantoate 2-reductase [Acidobacteriia bacterium]|nr:2-dehydropantoate 2-reductase [Terriglobia bacterium]
MKIAVMGSGAVGGYFGALLARSGNSVCYLARGANLSAMLEKGLQIDSVREGFTLPIRRLQDAQELNDASKGSFAFASDDSKIPGPVDLVLFCVKTYDTEAASKQCFHLVGPPTVFLPLQNGIDSHDKLGRDHGRNHVLAGVAYILSSLLQPGVIKHAGNPGRIVFGELDGSLSQRTQELHHIFEQAGFSSEVSSNIRKTLWEKFAMICANGGMSALTRATFGEMLSNTNTRSMLEKAMKEVVTVGIAEGVPFDPQFLEKTMKWTESLEPNGRASMHTDLANGKRLELEALNGRVLQLAKKHGIPVPMNFAIYAALAPHSMGRRDA